MQPKPLYQVIASTLQARANCIASGASHVEWKLRHESHLHDIERNLLPSGSGIDNGCKLELPDEYDGTFRLTFGYHRMDENGYYCGWTQHTLIVSPSLIGGFDLDLSLDGDADGTADYLYDVFNCNLSEVVEWDSERKCYRFAPVPVAIDPTCGCGPYIHPSQRNPAAIHIPDCQHKAPESSDVPAVSTASAEEAFEGKGR